MPKTKSQSIGWAGLQFLPELNETEVGFLLDKSFWGKRFATEATLGSIQFGLESWTLDHSIASAHPENTASRRVIEKYELVYAETIHLWRSDLMRHTQVRTAEQ